VFVEKERVETPEHVPLEFEVAGPMSRALAGLIDLALITLLLLVLSLLVLLAAAVAGLGSELRQYALAVFVLGSVAVFLGFHPFFELRRNGQTPGKRALGLRVLRQDGLPVDFRATLVRNLVRLVDMQPGLLYGVALVSMIVTRRATRLGDLGAGTWVVRERLEREPRAPERAEDESGAPHLAGAGSVRPPRPGRLTEKEFEVIGGFLARRYGLDPLRRRQLAGEIARPILERFRENAAEPERFLEEEHARGRGRGLL
jgi:uncharacterized RDD family membrane protein YckC